MGVDIALMAVIQAGSSPRRRSVRLIGAVADHSDVLAGAFGRAGSPLLRRIDPYKDLVLSSQDMDQLLVELSALLRGADEGETDLIRQVMDLAGRCKADPDTELHFQGD
jgi:hypothetical protein